MPDDWEYTEEVAQVPPGGRKVPVHAELLAERDRLREAFDLASSAFAHEVDGQHAKAARLIEAARERARGPRSEPA